MYRVRFESERAVDLLHYGMAARQHDRALRQVVAGDLQQTQDNTPSQVFRVFAISLRDDDAIRPVVQNHVALGLSGAEYAKQSVPNKRKLGVVSPCEMLGVRSKPQFEGRISRQQV